jgi:hypothetical protein
MEALSKPEHYYVTYRKGKYVDRAPELIYEYIDDLVLDAFVCQFSEAMIFHLYCCAEGLNVVKRHLRRHYGSIYSCSKYPLHNNEYLSFLAKVHSAECVAKVTQKIQKAHRYWENKNKQILLKPN